jgi:signal transduction histidine kinase
MGLQILVDEPLSAASAEIVSMMLKASSSMKDIINNTLDFSKIQNGRFQVSTARFFVGDLVRNSVYNMTPFAKEARVTISIEIGGSLENMEVDGDFSHLQQVVSNFLSNGIKFCPGDGTGQVKVKMEMIDQNLSALDLPGDLLLGW